MFGSKYPMAFRRENVNYHIDEAEELALINYTSGTTGYSKGVMLPYRSIWGNIEFIISRLGKIIKPGDNLLSILPMATCTAWPLNSSSVSVTVVTFSS